MMRLLRDLRRRHTAPHDTRSRAALGLGLALAACAPIPAGAPSREDLSEQAEKPAAEAPVAAYVDRFGGKLYLVLLDDKTHPSLRSGRSLWATSSEISYRPSNGADLINVPKGFVTDLASIPQAFWTLLPPDGPWVKAAVVHDYLYYTQGSGVWKCHARSITRAADYTRAEADWILRDAMEDRGVAPLPRNIIYLAVRLGGQHGWDARNHSRSCPPQPTTP
jgi:hypothetical protein